MTSCPPQRPGPHGRPIEILLIDDSYGDTLLTSQAFSGTRIVNNVTVARDGEEALRMLRRRGAFADQARPDIILLDLNLPGVDGREVLSRIKGDPAFNSIPVVILSGAPSETEVASTYALHANAYIAKPTDYRKLQEIVACIETFWFDVAILPGNVQGAI